MGTLAAVGLLAAERHRDAAPARGSWWEWRFRDVAMAMVGNLGRIAEAQLTDRDQRQGGKLHLYGAFGRVYPTGDGRRVMVVGADRPAVVGTAGGHRHRRGDGRRGRGDLGMSSPPRRRSLRGAGADRRGLRPVVPEADARPGVDAFAGTGKRFVGAASELPPAGGRGPARLHRESDAFERVRQPGIGEYLAPGPPLRLRRSLRGPGKGLGAGARRAQPTSPGRCGLPAGEIGDFHDRGVVAGPAARG